MHHYRAISCNPGTYPPEGSLVRCTLWRMHSLFWQYLLRCILQAFLTNAIFHVGRIGIRAGPFLTSSALNQFGWFIVVYYKKFAKEMTMIITILIPIFKWFWTRFSTNMAVKAGLVLLQTLPALFLECITFSFNQSFSAFTSTAHCLES